MIVSAEYQISKKNWQQFFFLILLAMPNQYTGKPEMCKKVKNSYKYGRVRNTKKRKFKKNNEL